MKTKTSISAVIKVFFILLVMCCFSCNKQPIYKVDSTIGNNSTAIGISALSKNVEIKVCKHGADWYHPTTDSTMCNDSLWLK